MKLFLIFILMPILSTAQYWGEQEVILSDLSPWVEKSQKDYAGIYHFGESESESDLILFFTDYHIIGQVKMGYWENKTGIWKNTFINLTNIIITEDGRFVSDQHSGKFVNHTYDRDNIIPCLRIDNPWTEWLQNNEWEIGSYTPLNFLDFFPGVYPEASYQELKPENLNKLSKKELSLIRNEIFARYGYRFRKDGTMNIYFEQQPWYRAQHDNVNAFLTAVETFNILLITGFENGSKD